MSIPETETGRVSSHYETDTLSESLLVLHELRRIYPLVGNRTLEEAGQLVIPNFDRQLLNQLFRVAVRESDGQLILPDHAPLQSDSTVTVYDDPPEVVHRVRRTIEEQFEEVKLRAVREEELYKKLLEKQLVIPAVLNQ